MYEHDSTQLSPFENPLIEQWWCMDGSAFLE